jgi:osmotically-inducible protein OsmY
MKTRVLVGLLGVVIAAATALPTPAQNGVTGASVPEQRIGREVRHQIVMLPFLNVFDYISFKVEGNIVTLNGSVTQPTVKIDAERSVKGIEGVTKVVNNIDVLPPSTMDQQLRLRLFRAIYGFPALQKYDLSVIKPIRILVKSGHVTLEGVVDNEADKNLAGLRANTVSGIFSVTNNLMVVKS